MKLINKPYLLYSESHVPFTEHILAQWLPSWGPERWSILGQYFVNRCPIPCAFKNIITGCRPFSNLQNWKLKSPNSFTNYYSDVDHPSEGTWRTYYVSISQQGSVGCNTCFSRNFVVLGNLPIYLKHWREGRWWNCAPDAIIIEHCSIFCNLES